MPMTKEEFSAYWEPYRKAPSDTVERWIYLAACYTHCLVGQEAQHIQRSKDVGTYAFNHKVCIFHAAWELSAKLYPCMCSPCQEAHK